MRRGDVQELNPYYNETSALSWIMEMKKVCQMRGERRRTDE